MKNQHTKKKHRWIIPVVIVVLILGFLGISGSYVYSRAKAMKRQATGLKEDLKAVISCLAGLDTEGADQAIGIMDQDIEEIRIALAEPLWQYAVKVPKVGEEVLTASNLVDLLAETSDEILKPAVELLKEYPLSALRQSGGFNMAMIDRYMDFFGEMVPKLESIADRMSTMELRFVDSDGKLMAYMQQFIVIADLASEAKTDLLDPLLKQMEETPLSQLKAGNGFNAKVIVSYMDFAEGIIPKIEGFADTVHGTDFSLLDDGGRIDGYLGKLDSLLQIYEENKMYLPLLRMLLGDGSDRYYVIVAQNSAEIRASGGIPGSFGYLSITDGIIELGDFSRALFNLDLLAPTSVEQRMRGEDQILFGDLVVQSWDACLCPDFERVGAIWAGTYAKKNQVEVDGIISLTPPVIQDLLKIYGEVTLSDGTVINGENATRILQHDLYFAYHSKGNDISDAELDKIFAETAKMTMAKVVSGFSVKQLIELMNIFKQRTQDRTIMMWFADEEEQAMCQEMGCSGGLSKDPLHPTAGVYYSCITAGKLGWYFDLKIEQSDATIHPDGTQSYEIVVTISNMLTEEDYNAGSVQFIIGGNDGAMISNLELFAPMGGTIENLQLSRDIPYGDTNYEGLQLIYINNFRLSRNDPLTITYTITTAPNPETELTFSTTPTLQEYRD